MTVLKRRICFGLVASVIVVGAVFYMLRSPPPAVVVALPVPNGYDSIAVSPAFVMNSDEPPARGDKDFSLARAKHYATNNEAIIPIIRGALTSQWAVPFQFSDNWLTEHYNRDLPKAKQIAHLISCAGYVAEQEGRNLDALKLYLDGLKFGSAVAHGGLLIDSLVSLADERIALTALNSVAPKLDVNDCRFVLADLETWKTNRQPFELTLQQEKKWADAYGRLQVGVFRMEMMRLAEMIKAKILHPEDLVIARAKGKYDSVIVIVDALRVRLAMRAFELEHKSSPKGWSDLVPAYMAEIPIDPTTKRTMVFSF